MFFYKNESTKLYGQESAIAVQLGFNEILKSSRIKSKKIQNFLNKFRKVPNHILKIEFCDTVYSV